MPTGASRAHGRGRSPRAMRHHTRRGGYRHSCCAAVRPHPAHRPSAVTVPSRSAAIRTVPGEHHEPPGPNGSGALRPLESRPGRAAPDAWPGSAGRARPATSPNHLRYLGYHGSRPGWHAYPEPEGGRCLAGLSSGPWRTAAQRWHRQKFTVWLAGQRGENLPAAVTKTQRGAARRRAGQRRVRRGPRPGCRRPPRGRRRSWSACGPGRSCGGCCAAGTAVAGRACTRLSHQ